MKNTFVIILFNLLLIASCTTLLQAGNNLSENLTEEVAAPGKPVKVCIITPAGYICIDVLITFKETFKDDLKLKASVSGDGRSISMFGFPPSFNGQNFKISKSQYSGFDQDGNKLFLQPGTYKVSKGKAKVTVGKGKG